MNFGRNNASIRSFRKPSSMFNLPLSKLRLHRLSVEASYKLDEIFDCHINRSIPCPNNSGYVEYPFILERF